MDSLRSLASPTAQVIRSGKNETVPSAQVTVGDLVEVKTGEFRSLSPTSLLPLNCISHSRDSTGDVIPADLRLVEAMNFETDEALLTGESLPVAKDMNATWDTKSADGMFDPRDIGVGGGSLLDGWCLRELESSFPARISRSHQHGLHLEYGHEGSCQGNCRRDWDEDGDWRYRRVASWRRHSCSQSA
jgi:hypothetical protein